METFNNMLLLILLCCYSLPKTKQKVLIDFVFDWRLLLVQCVSVQCYRDRLHNEMKSLPCENKNRIWKRRSRRNARSCSSGKKRLQQSKNAHVRVFVWYKNKCSRVWIEWANWTSQHVPVRVYDVLFRAPIVHIPASIWTYLCVRLPGLATEFYVLFQFHCLFLISFFC